MPTYHASGITARLTTTPLKPSLSNVTDLRMGAEQKNDANRVDKLLAKADKLSEKPIGADGSERGVAQFIGTHSDMALFMVEASENLHKHKQSTSITETATEDSASSGSPLSSLGATPTPTTENFANNVAGANSSPTMTARELQPVHSTEQTTLEQALRAGGDIPETDDKALVVDIQLESDVFLAVRGSSASPGKDLKIEVFINGQLVNHTFINAKRSAAQVVGSHIRFSGTRVHRQAEKPWVYVPGEVPTRNQSAEQRWTITANALQKEAHDRGTDHLGDLPPTSEYLGALATIGLPKRLEDAHTLGIVDVVITAGKGQKYGPDTPYITEPTRMDDLDYSVTNPAVDPVLLAKQDSFELFGGGAVVSPLKSMMLADAAPQDSSPEVPLRSRQRKPSTTTSPSPSKVAGTLIDGLEFDVLKSKTIIVDQFDNKKGKPGPSGRTLHQRLGDLKKMNEQNQAQELDFLKSRYSEVFASTTTTEVSQEEERPVKRLRADSNIYVDPRAMMNSQTTQVDEQMKDDDVFRIADPEAVLTQKRIDMALDAGMDSNSALLRHIAASSPQRSPLRMTKASALAYSPTRTAVKPQRHPGPAVGTPTKRAETTPTGDRAPRTPATGAAAAMSPTRSGRGSNRNARQWIPGEISHADALAEYNVPEASKGCAVTFSENRKAMRQIGKVRNGSFKELTLVVGMRFVVW